VFRNRRSVQYILGTDVDRDGNGGTVAVAVTTGTGPIPHRLCAAVPEHQGPDQNCRVVTTASGMRVRLSSSARQTPDGRNLPIRFASVAYDGFVVTVRETQLGGMLNKPPMSTPIFS